MQFQQITFVDQIGHKVTQVNKPERIISLVPSQTELLFYLGLDKQVVGLTKFCIKPNSKVKSLPKVGGTKKLNLEKIASLKPHLIIANKEENLQTDIVWLQKRFQVYTSNIFTLTDALQMITDIGKLTGKNTKAQNLKNKITQQFSVFPVVKNQPSVIYLIWQKPFMAVGNNTFINFLLTKIGFKNAITKSRYPEIDIETINKISPKYIFLSTEPFPFNQKHVQQLSKIFKNSEVRLVNGQMFSWYGNRLLLFTNYINQKLILQL